MSKKFNVPSFSSPDGYVTRDNKDQILTMVGLESYQNAVNNMFPSKPTGLTNVILFFQVDQSGRVSSKFYSPHDVWMYILSLKFQQDHLPRIAEVILKLKSTNTKPGLPFKSTPVITNAKLPQSRPATTRQLPAAAKSVVLPSAKPVLRPVKELTKEVEHAVKEVFIANLVSIHSGLKGERGDKFSMKDFVARECPTHIGGLVRAMEMNEFYSLYFKFILSKNAYDRYFSQINNSASNLISMLSIHDKGKFECNILSNELCRLAKLKGLTTKSKGGSHLLTIAISQANPMKTILYKVIGLDFHRKNGAKFDIIKRASDSRFADVYFYPLGV